MAPKENNRRARRLKKFMAIRSINKSLQLTDVMRCLLNEWVDFNSKLRFIAALPKDKKVFMKSLADELKWSKNTSSEEESDKLVRLLALVQSPHSTCQWVIQHPEKFFRDDAGVQVMTRLISVKIHNSDVLLFILFPLQQLQHLHFESCIVISGSEQVDFLPDMSIVFSHLKNLVLSNCFCDLKVENRLIDVKQLTTFELHNVLSNETFISDLLPYVTSFTWTISNNLVFIFVISPLSSYDKLQKLKMSSVQPHFEALLGQALHLHSLELKGIARHVFQTPTIGVWSIRQLHLLSMMIEFQFIQFVQKYCPMLEDVKYVQCDELPLFTYNQIQSIQPYFERLTSLDADYDMLLSFSSHVTLLQPCPKLTHLSWRRVTIDDRFYGDEILRRCPNLTTLTLQELDCGEIFLRLISLADTLVHLEEMNLISCTTDSLATAYDVHVMEQKFPPLKKLTVQRMSVVLADLTYMFVMTSATLTHFHLQFCQSKHFHRIDYTLCRASSLREFIWEVDWSFPKHGVKKRQALLADWHVKFPCIRFVLRQSLYREGDFSQKVKDRDLIVVEPST